VRNGDVLNFSTKQFIIIIIIIIITYQHHHNISFMELGHLLTRSDLTYPEVSSKVNHDSFCQLGSSISLPWVIYFEAFYLYVLSGFTCIPVICPKLMLFLASLQFVHLFCKLFRTENQAGCFVTTLGSMKTPKKLLLHIEFILHFNTKYGHAKHQAECCVTTLHKDLLHGTDVPNSQSAKGAELHFSTKYTR